MARQLITLLVVALFSAANALEFLDLVRYYAKWSTPSKPAPAVVECTFSHFLQFANNTHDLSSASNVPENSSIL